METFSENSEINNADYITKWSSTGERKEAVN